MNSTAAKSVRGEWMNLGAFAIAATFILFGCLAAFLVWQRGILVDFLSYWAAGRLIVEGHASAAYDIARHHAVESTAVRISGFLPFPYPPPFLFIVAPLGLAAFSIAFGAWIAVTASAYCVAVWRRLPARFALAQAAAAANFITGQNGFLTSAIFIHGTNLIASRPMLAGATLGLLIIKPQLAILLPVALVAGREWRAIAGGILSSSALLLLSLMIFGLGPYRGFLAILPHYSHWLSLGRWPWGELASPFALLRFFGVPQSLALTVHGAIALVAAGMTARSWMLKEERRVAILGAATLLAPPYLFTYDALLLTVPLAWLIRNGVRGPAFGAVWVFSLLPVISYLTNFPNTIPLASITALWLLHRQPDVGPDAAQIVVPSKR